ncbi:MAG: flavodoxin family protein [Methanomicrobiales archaeon]|jgi:multimeric flavodoxin WrbA|nr:flavodoxin family protein [Methanomicrobiales archaeon]
MAKVLLLCGSPRPGGNTAKVIEECAVVLRGLGMDTDTVSLAGRKIESCTACLRCRDEGSCHIDDGLNEIVGKLRDAEGFIVATPVYFGTARGDVMSALQRIGMVSMATDNFLSWKVGGPIAVGRRGGHTATIQEMLMFFLINEMIVPGSNYWNMVFGRDPGDVQKDNEGMATIRLFAENVAELISRIHYKSRGDSP